MRRADTIALVRVTRSRGCLGASDDLDGNESGFGRLLRNRQIKEALTVVEFERRSLWTFYDPDNHTRGFFHSRPPEIDLLPNRIPPGPVLTCQRLIDDHDPLGGQTEISTPLVGMSWQPTELENRRVL
jgi:hypothetical protein